MKKTLAALAAMTTLFATTAAFAVDFKHMTLTPKYGTGEVTIVIWQDDQDVEIDISKGGKFYWNGDYTGIDFNTSYVSGYDKGFEAGVNSHPVIFIEADEFGTGSVSITANPNPEPNTFGLGKDGSLYWNGINTGITFNKSYDAGYGAGQNRAYERAVEKVQAQYQDLIEHQKETLDSQAEQLANQTELTNTAVANCKSYAKYLLETFAPEGVYHEGIVEDQCLKGIAN